MDANEMDTPETVGDKIKRNIYFAQAPIEKKRSENWKKLKEIFRSDDKSQVKGFVACAICDVILRYETKKLGTRHLTYHLNTHNQVAPKIVQFFSTTKKISPENRQKIQKACIEYITKDLRPYNSVGGDGMLILLQSFMKLGSIYGSLELEEIHKILPSVQTISRHIQIQAKDAKSKLGIELKNVLLERGTIPITLDLWQDKYKRISYLGMTCQYYKITSVERSSHISLEDRVICMQPLECGVVKNAQFVKQAIKNKLHELQIEEFFNRIIFVTDRGGNIRKALESTERIDCFPHFLNNIVEATCRIDVVKNKIDRCKGMVRFFKITGLNNKLPTALKSGCDTRFNYIYLTFDSILNNWNTVDEVLRGINEIHRMEGIIYSDLKAFSDYLKKFDEWTKMTSASKSPTLYKVWIGIHDIMQNTKINSDDNPIVTLMKVKAFQYIKDKFVLRRLHRLATFLHPCYKSLRFASFELIQKTHFDMRQELNHSYRLEGNESVRSVSPTSSSSSLLDYADTSEENDELVNYLQYKCPSDTEIDILEWWESKVKEFPKLSQIALKIHSIPASSIPSERSFSTSGNIITEKRSRLSPESIEDIIILHGHKS